MRLALEDKRQQIFTLGESLLRANDDLDGFTRNFKLHLEFVSWLLRYKNRKQLHSLRKLLKDKKGNHWRSYAYLSIAFASVYMTKTPDVDVAKTLMKHAEASAPPAEKPVLDCYQGLFIAIHASRIKNKPEVTKVFLKEALVHSQHVLDKCHLVKADIYLVRLIHLMVLINYYFSKGTTPVVVSHLLSVFKEIDLAKIPDEYKYVYMLARGVINDKQKRYKEASADYELAVYFAPHSRKGRAMATQYTQELIRGLVGG